MEVKGLSWGTQSGNDKTYKEQIEIKFGRDTKPQ